MRNIRYWLRHALLLLLLVPALAACGWATRASNESQSTGQDDIVNIAPNQTAFQIPVTGGNESGQVQFDSADYLEKNKVPAKQATIHKELKGGAYYPTTYVYLVTREPVSVQWTSNTGTGTNQADESLCGESIEGVQICFQITLAAGINEKDAATYLYYYPSASLQDPKVGGVFSNTPLKQVVDNQIRNYVLDLLSKAAKERKLSEIIPQANAIVLQAEKDAKDYFAKQGITIAYLGMGGEIELDPAIQKVINDLYIAQQQIEIAKLEATKTAINAEAERHALEVKGQGDAAALKAIEDAVGGPENLAKMAGVIEAYRWDGSKLTVQLTQNGGQVPVAIPVPQDTKVTPAPAAPTPTAGS